MGAKKLTEQHVKSIRKYYATGKYTLADLARAYDVTTSTVYAIVCRRTWKHV